MSFFSAVRLSKHFTLLDFLNGHTLYSSGRPLKLAEISPSHIRTGQRLCEELLEPMIALWGPMSISNGFIPKDLLGNRWTPHTWNPADGAAADIIVHDWVNQDFSPISLVGAMIYQNLPFERLITYAGSEAMCVSTARQPKNRGAIYENVRVPGSTRPEFVTWSRGGKYPSHLLQAPGFPKRENWRRVEGEPSYHTQGMIRAQHIRLGRYFVALDFCRNETAIEAGRPWVPAFRKPEVLEAGRCMAEVLDTVVAKVGRISVTRGITRPGDGVHDNHTWDGPTFSLEFALPLGADIPGIEHPGLVSAKWREDAPGGSPRCTITVKRFKLAKVWSSTVQPVSK